MVESEVQQVGMIDGYTCVKTIGCGATSKVKLMKNSNGKLFAFKIYDLKYKKKALEILRNEAKSYNWLKHPNIIKFYELNESAIYHKKDGREVEVAYMSLEYISGGELFYYV